MLNCFFSLSCSITQNTMSLYCMLYAQLFLQPQLQHNTEHTVCILCSMLNFPFDPNTRLTCAATHLPTQSSRIVYNHARKLCKPIDNLTVVRCLRFRHYSQSVRQFVLPFLAFLVTASELNCWLQFVINSQANPQPLCTEILKQLPRL